MKAKFINENMNEQTIRKIVRNQLDFPVHKILYVINNESLLYGLWGNCLAYNMPRTLDALEIFIDEIGRTIQRKLYNTDEVEYEWSENAYNNIMKIKNLITK
jgi:hypothetical protein